MPRTKKQIGLRVKDESIALMEALQRYHGLSQAGLFEMLMREAGRRAGILLPTGEVTAKPKPAAKPKRSHKKKVAA